MKKLVVFLVLLLIPYKVYAHSSECAVVMDADSGRVLYSKNGKKQKLIASTTKIMTALIALEYGDLDEKVVVGDEILKAYGSAIYIEIDEEITLKDLLYGLLLRSGNDAAIEIAYAVSGSMESFVYLMNEKASMLGMSDTIFYNNHGLEEQNGKGNVSTAYDMALLMKYAINNDFFMDISSTLEYTAKSNYKTYIWPNKNKLLKMYKYTTAGKTGYTEKAKRTLVTSASKDGKNLVVVTLNDGNDFNDHMNFYEEYFNYELVKVIDKNNYKIEEDFYKGNLVVNSDFKLLVNNEEKKKLKTNVVLQKKEKYYNDDYVGYVQILVGDEVIDKVNIYIKKEEEYKKKKKSWLKRVVDFLIFWD